MHKYQKKEIQIVTYNQNPLVNNSLSACPALAAGMVTSPGKLNYPSLPALAGTLPPRRNDLIVGAKEGHPHRLILMTLGIGSYHESRNCSIIADFLLS